VCLNVFVILIQLQVKLPNIDSSGAADCNGITGCLKGDHQYVALRRQWVMLFPIPRPGGRNTHYERKRRKNGRDQHDEDQQQTEKALTIGHLECAITVQTRRPRSAINSTYFMQKRIHLQTWHSCLIDERHFSDIIDVMARRDANIDSHHTLVVIKLRARICRAINT
jgi:hypothetical protein